MSWTSSECLLCPGGRGHLPLDHLALLIIDWFRRQITEQVLESLKLKKSSRSGFSQTWLISSNPYSEMSFSALSEKKLVHGIWMKHHLHRKLEKSWKISTTFCLEQPHSHHCMLSGWLIFISISDRIYVDLRGLGWHMCWNKGTNLPGLDPFKKVSPVFNSNAISSSCSVRAVFTRWQIWPCVYKWKSWFWH